MAHLFQPAALITGDFLTDFLRTWLPSLKHILVALRRPIGQREPEREIKQGGDLNAYRAYHQQPFRGDHELPVSKKVT